VPARPTSNHPCSRFHRAISKVVYTRHVCACFPSRSNNDMLIAMSLDNNLFIKPEAHTYELSITSCVSVT
jgi:hypothetical protein